MLVSLNYRRHNCQYSGQVFPSGRWREIWIYHFFPKMRVGKGWRFMARTLTVDHKISIIFWRSIYCKTINCVDVKYGCVFIGFLTILDKFEWVFMEFGTRSHGFSLGNPKNNVLGVFWHFGFHPQVLASADIWNFEGHIFTKMTYFEWKFFWCQKYPMDSMGKYQQEICIFSYSIMRFMGKLRHPGIFSFENRKISIFSHFYQVENSDAKGIPWFFYSACVLRPIRIS